MRQPLPHPLSASRRSCGRRKGRGGQGEGAHYGHTHALCLRAGWPPPHPWQRGSTGTARSPLLTHCSGAAQGRLAPRVVARVARHGLRHEHEERCGVGRGRRGVAEDRRRQHGAPGHDGGVPGPTNHARLGATGMSRSLLGRGIRSDAEVALERLLQLSNAKDALDVLFSG